MVGRKPQQSVLIVTDDAVDADALRAVLDDPAPSTTILSDPTAVFDELTRSATHCLVLPATIDGQRGTDLAVGVAALYPDLPIVVTGVDPATVPDDRDVIAVETADLVSPPVVAAIEDAIASGPPRVAGRPPSPMETLLLSLFDGMSNHLFVKDEQARHVMIGGGYYEPTDRLGMTDLALDDLADEHVEASYRDEMALLNEEIERIDAEQFLDREAAYVRICKVPWYDSEGDIRGLVGSAWDITEQKNHEHALRRQRERLVKVALVAAHEFRNELQIAHGRLELLDGEQAHVDEIVASLTRIASLVDTIVELSTDEHQRPREEPVWLSRLSREVWDTMSGRAATLEIEDDCRVVADQESTGLLLQFLFQNALEHADPTVTVTVGATPDGFFVANDGPPIDTEPPESVFDAGYTTVDGNTGFGLYIAKTVAEDQDWTLSLSTGGEWPVRFDIGNVDRQE